MWAIMETPRKFVLIINGISLAKVAHSMGFPLESKGWSNKRIMLEISQLSTDSMVAFAMGLHERLGQNATMLELERCDDILTIVMRAYYGIPMY